MPFDNTVIQTTDCCPRCQEIPDENAWWDEVPNESCEIEPAAWKLAAKLVEQRLGYNYYPHPYDVAVAKHLIGLSRSW